MADKSFFKGFLGLLMFFAGLYFLWGALAGGIFWTFIGGMLGVNVTACLGLFLFEAIGGAILAWFGAKLFFENEDGFLRLLIGAGGIITLILAVLIAVAGLAGAPETLGISAIIAGVSVIIMLALGLSMIDFGFSLKVMPYADKIMGTTKELATGKKR